MLRPDYHGGGIVNLMASVRRGLGDDTPLHPVAPLLPPEEIAGVEKFVLLVADGLGDDFLLRSLPGGALAAHRRGALTSVFPPTTASAITTFMTGEAPAQHGLTGWFTYFAELGSVVAVLPYQDRHGGASLQQSAGIEPAALFGVTPLANRLDLPLTGVAPEAIIHSDFNVSLSGRGKRAGYASLDGMFDALLAAVREPGRRCVYGYFPEIDTLAHHHGVDAPQTLACLAALDGAFARFLDALHGEDVLVALTADHGLIDMAAERIVHVAEHPVLENALVLPLSGEPRAAYCYVHPGQVERFERYVRNELAHCAELYPSTQLLEEQWFGLGTPHPRLARRIGHYLLLMKDNWVIKDWVAGETPHFPRGIHGGLHRGELFVPLVVARP